MSFGGGLHTIWPLKYPLQHQGHFLTLNMIINWLRDNDLQCDLVFVEIIDKNAVPINMRNVSEPDWYGPGSGTLRYVDKGTTNPLWDQWDWHPHCWRCRRDLISICLTQKLCKYDNIYSANRMPGASFTYMDQL